MFGSFDISGISARSCTFENCRLGYNSMPFSAKRDTVNNCELIDCKISGCLLGPAEIRSTRINHLSGDMLICWGTLFDQVVLEGKISSLMLHGIPRSDASEVARKSHRSIAKEFYSKVNWALDISNAKFNDFTIRTGAVPLSLVRRDVNSQFLISNERSELSYDYIEALSVSPYTKIILNMMIDEELTESLLVAPKLDMSLFEQVLQDADVLAKKGLLV